MVNDLVQTQPQEDLRLASAQACSRGVYDSADKVKINVKSDEVQDGQVEDDYLPLILRLINRQAQQEGWEKYKADM